MNKKFMSILTALVVCLVVSHCAAWAADKTKSMAFPNDRTADEWITPVNAIDMSGMSLYCQSDNIYFAADSNAKVSLYVQAGKNDDGTFQLDDGQDWLLIMETSFGNYPLFSRKFVQLGMVDYIVFNEYSDNASDIFHVLVTVKMSASYDIYDCIFINDEKAFKTAPVYSAMNINPVGSSR